jgi:hypothetical protein
MVSGAAISFKLDPNKKTLWYLAEALVQEG